MGTLKNPIPPRVPIQKFENIPAYSEPWADPHWAPQPVRQDLGCFSESRRRTDSLQTPGVGEGDTEIVHKRTFTPTADAAPTGHVGDRIPPLIEFKATDYLAYSPHVVASCSEFLYEEQHMFVDIVLLRV